MLVESIYLVSNLKLAARNCVEMIAIEKVGIV